MKTCSKCRMEKELDGFHRNKKAKDGHTSICKVCACKKSNEWAKNNTEQHASSVAAYQSRHPATKRKENTERLLALTERCCTVCGETKDISEFGRTSKKRGRKQLAICKKCALAQTVKWQRENPEKRAVISARYYKNNPEKMQSIRPRQEEQRQRRHAENPQKSLMTSSTWKRNNRAKCNASLASYKAKKLQATPAWANTFFIEEIYDLAQRRTEATGIEWQVDHIIPLNSKTVCGLHVEDNLQVIPAVLNRKKGNRYSADPQPRQFLHI